MEITIPVTQLRTHIAAILRRLRENPRIVYRITHHREVVAELKAPGSGKGSETSASTEEEVVAFIDAYLAKGAPGEQGAYQRIRALCATPSDALPYQSVEEAMAAIRGRGHGADRF